MDLTTVQIIFYSLGSIFFAILVLALIFIVVATFVIYKKITKISSQLNQTVTQVKDIYDNKEKYILKLATKGSSSLIENVLNIFTKNKK